MEASKLLTCYDLRSQRIKLFHWHEGPVTGEQQLPFTNGMHDFNPCNRTVGATTAGLSQLLEGEVSHDQVMWHLSGKKKTAVDLWLTVKPLVRLVQSEEDVLIIDDSYGRRENRAGCSW